MEFIKRYRNFLFVLIFSLIPLLPLLSSSLLYTQDGWTHLIRGAAYFKALQDLNIPPRLAGDLNYGYSMPMFVFVFQLPYQLFALFISFGLNLAVSLKLIIAIGYILSAVFMYLFTKEFFKDTNKAIFSTFLYQFFPYRFVDMYLRGSIGEALTFAFFPLVLYGILLVNKRKVLSFICISFGTAALILSHLATGGVFVILSIIFMLVFTDLFKNKIMALLSLIYGLLLSFYYFIPAIIEHKYTYGDLFAKDLYKENFASLDKIFLPSLLNSDAVKIGDVSVNLGLSHIAIAVFLVLSFFVFKSYKTKEKKILIFSSIIFILSIFIISNISKPFWDSISFLRQFQFPWRFLSQIGFSLALAGGVFAGYFKSRVRLFYLLILIVVLTTVGYWSPPLGYKKIVEREMWDYPMTTTYFGETDVIWSAGPAKSFPQKRVEVISGEGIISSFKNTNNSQKFIVNAKTPISVVSRLQYFPGWKVSVNGMDAPIQFQDPNNRGLLVFNAPKGESNVSVEFFESKIRLMGDLVTLIAIILLIPVIFLIKKTK